MILIQGNDNIANKAEERRATPFLLQPSRWEARDLQNLCQGLNVPRSQPYRMGVWGRWRNRCMTYVAGCRDWLSALPSSESIRLPTRYCWLGLTSFLWTFWTVTVITECLLCGVNSKILWKSVVRQGCVDRRTDLRMRNENENLK